MGKLTHVGHIRGKTIESAANTYTESTMNTNINPLNNQIIAIHDVTIEIENLGVDQTTEKAEVALIKDSKNSMIHQDDEDMLAKVAFDLNVITSGGSVIDTVKQIHFDPPEIIAETELILAVQGTGLAAAMTATVDVRYTPETVNDATFVKLRK